MRFQKKYMLTHIDAFLKSRNIPRVWIRLSKYGKPLGISLMIGNIVINDRHYESNFKEIICINFENCIWRI